MPPINTIVKAIPDHEQPETAWFPLNRTLGYHDACDCFRVLDKFIRQDMGEPCCLTEYLCEGDLYNSHIDLSPYSRRPTRRGRATPAPTSGKPTPPGPA